MRRICSLLYSLVLVISVGGCGSISATPVPTPSLASATPIAVAVANTATVVAIATAIPKPILPTSTTTKVVRHDDISAELKAAKAALEQGDYDFAAQVLAPLQKNSD